MGAICLLDDIAPDFPHTDSALHEPNGLLAIGGNLKPKTLIQAYSKGIFPWFSEDQPILWWSPDPRMMLTPNDVHIGRSLKKSAKKRLFQISVDRAFGEVISMCAQIERDDQEGTWISEDVIKAYTSLHDLGYAHSVEAWQNDRLVGGLYGVAIGAAFFGESMFSAESGASKQAFITLVRQLELWGYQLIDCQVHTRYLKSFGARELERDQFEKLLEQAVSTPLNVNWPRDWSASEFGYDGT